MSEKTQGKILLVEINSLEHFPVLENRGVIGVVGVWGVPHYELTPNVFARIQHRVTKCEAAFDSGGVDAGTWAIVKERYDSIKEWAVEKHGEDALQAANKRLSAEAA